MKRERSERVREIGSRWRRPLEVRIAFKKSHTLRSQVEDLRKKGVKFEFHTLTSTPNDLREAVQDSASMTHDDLKATTVRYLLGPHSRYDSRFPTDTPVRQAIAQEMPNFMYVTADTTNATDTTDFHTNSVVATLNRELDPERKSYVTHRLTSDRAGDETRELKKIGGTFLGVDAAATGLNYLGFGWAKSLALLTAGSFDDFLGGLAVISTKRSGGKKFKERLANNKATLAVLGGAITAAGLTDFFLLPKLFEGKFFPELFGNNHLAAASIIYWATAVAGSLAVDVVDVFKTGHTLGKLNKTGDVPGYRANELSGWQIAGKAIQENLSNPYKRWLAFGLATSLGLSYLAGTHGWLEGTNPLVNGFWQAGIGPIETVAAMVGSFFLDGALYGAGRRAKLVTKLAVGA